MKNQFPEDQDNLIMDELLFFLQEKRTALSMIRIGIAILISQIVILGFLIATSKFYKWLEVLHLWILFIFINIVLLCIAIYFIFRSISQIHRLDRQITRYKKSHGTITGFMDD